MSKNEKVKVLYIAGWGRSGTTLLDNILGQLDGFFSGGEIRYIWEQGLLQDQKCGCGCSFSNCDTWQSIINDTFGGEKRLHPAAVNKMTLRYTRTMRMFWLIAVHGGNRNSKSFSDYLRIIEDLYLGIARKTKSHVLVDSSKFPVYGGILRLVPSLDVYLLHIIRDPRAVAHSWMVSKPISPSEPQIYMPKINPVLSALQWSTWNLAVEYIGNLQPDRYLRLSYEEFVSHPRSSVDAILTLLGEAPPNLPFKDEFTVVMEKNHAIGGNPSRFLQGDVTIKPDIRWLSDMHPYRKFIVTLLTLPFLSHFGYPRQIISERR